MNWLDTAARLSRENTGFVLVTVLETQGSAPRDAAAKMVVAADATYDSIGGGRLEFEAAAMARQLLADGRAAVQTRAFTLGNDLAQCCGGRITLLLECFPACAFHIALFGAGHVGRALAVILSELPCRVRWHDSRAEIFPPTVAPNIETVAMKNPFEAVENCPPAAFYLVMTHSHDLDFELCEAMLNRADARYCGLIGSRSKAASFRGRLRKKGFAADELSRLTCPIGRASIRGKTPMEVAISITAELLELRHHATAESPKSPLRTS